MDDGPCFCTNWNVSSGMVGNPFIKTAADGSQKMYDNNIKKKNNKKKKGKTRTE